MNVKGKIHLLRGDNMMVIKSRSRYLILLNIKNKDNCFCPDNRQTYALLH